MLKRHRFLEASTWLPCHYCLRHIVGEVNQIYPLKGQSFSRRPAGTGAQSRRGGYDEDRPAMSGSLARTGCQVPSLPAHPPGSDGRSHCSGRQTARSGSRWAGSVAGNQRLKFGNPCRHPLHQRLLIPQQRVLLSLGQPENRGKHHYQDESRRRVRCKPLQPGGSNYRFRASSP